MGRLLQPRRERGSVNKMPVFRGKGSGCLGRALARRSELLVLRIALTHKFRVQQNARKSNRCRSEEPAFPRESA